MRENKVMASQLEAFLMPVITAQENYYRHLGIRDRIQNLPLMVGAVCNCSFPLLKNEENLGDSNHHIY
ncbi:MAG: hypothetical protein GVY17_12880 [Cyanobacteria bacterium]|nr:hypothetical protein [Cyanobacteria bacterium GSL.Bin21]